MKFTWNPAIGEFTTTTGKRIPEEKIRAGLGLVLQRSEMRMNQLAEQLKTGRITLSQWQARSQNEIKYVHAVSAASAHGGFSRLGANELQNISQKVSEQIGYFNRFVSDVQSGKQRLTGKLNQRAKSYSRAAFATYFLARTFNRIAEALRQSKRLQVRRMLGKSEHCADCQQQVSLGWMESGDTRFLPIGTSKCRFNCKCFLIYRME